MPAGSQRGLDIGEHESPTFLDQNTAVDGPASILVPKGQLTRSSRGSKNHAYQ